MEATPNKSSGIQSDIERLTAELSSGKFQEVLDRVTLLLPLAKSRIQRGACHFLIGAALNEQGNSDQALPHFLEATLTYPTDQPFLVGHAQLEISEMQNEQGHNESALFFIDMAISNFSLIQEMAGTPEVKEECKNLREKILKELEALH